VTRPLTPPDLEPAELVKLQHVSRQLLNLSRDNNLWKTLCFEHSTAERRRRRLAGTEEPHTSHADARADADARLAELIEAANTLSATFDTSVHDPSAPSADVQVARNREKRRVALVANWDPSYPGEPINWYADFIQRHAPPHVTWFEGAAPPSEGPDDAVCREATGAGILFGSDGLADRLVAPADDGSIAIWDARANSDRYGAVVAQSEMGLLANRGSELDYATRLRQSQAIMTDSGAVECVSIDSVQRRAFFAVQNTLTQVDLSTLQVVARTPYPFPITALSEAHATTPLTVGTNWTIHLHDPRCPSPALAAGDTDTSFSRLTATSDHVSLAQPGALSIAHLPTTRDWDGNGDIWVSGRFTSLLNLDRRFFPRLRGTLHSGARISCLTTIPYPFIPHASRLSTPSVLAAAKSAPGHTLVAAGEYKGKGSLELYGLSSDPVHSVSSSDTRSASNAAAAYQNRQTAARSKLLAVASHGSRLVFADADGALKWVERDATTPVRELNVNDFSPGTSSSSSSSSSPTPASPATPPHIQLINPSTAPERPDAYVQKLLPTTTAAPGVTAAAAAAAAPAPLLFWTSAGALGSLTFGSRAPGADEFVDALEHQADGDGGGGEKEREREYGAEMRRALEMQARELRWLRGYGL
jgi:hypothetical protein